MKQYETYKESGISWIERIPTHWDVVRLKDYLTLEKGKNPEEITDEVVGYPYLTMDYLRDRDDIFVQYPTSTEDLLLIEDDELIVLWDGANAGEFMLSKKGFLGSTMAHISIVSNKLNKHFCFYLLKALETITKKITKGTTVPHFTSSVLLFEEYPIPPLSEQERIVEYLDYKCGDIDNQITVLEKEQKAYERLKVAVINRAVTEGLAPEVPKRDSGLQWLGMIPEHWEVKRLKEYLVLEKGKNPKEITDEAISYPYLTMDYLRDKQDVFVQYPISAEGLLLIDEKELVVLWDGANAGEIMMSKKGYLGSTMAIIRVISKKLDKHYCFYFLKSIEPMCKKLTKGTTVPHLNSSVILYNEYPIPPLSEQNAIVGYLDTKCAAIETKIGNIAKRIEAYKRLKRALINEVVTGTRKVF